MLFSGTEGAGVTRFRVLLASLFTVLAFAGFTASAQAGSNASICMSWGCAQFTDTGEYVRANDTASDGRGATASFWTVNGYYYRTCGDGNGANNGWTTCNYATPEGLPYRLTVQLWQGGNHIMSSGYVGGIT